MTKTVDAVIICCTNTGFGECWNCGGSRRAVDPDTGISGPFEGDERFCSEECCAEAHELWERQERQRQAWFACCPECGFDNQEHDTGCSKSLDAARS